MLCSSVASSCMDMKKGSFTGISMAKSSPYKDFPHMTCVHIIEGIPFNVYEMKIDWQEVYLEWVKIIRSEHLE